MRIARNTGFTPPPTIVFGRASSTDAATAADSPRVLRLFGTWAASGDAFALEAVLSVSAGNTRGPIRWKSDRRPSLAGIELNVGVRSVVLHDELRGGIREWQGQRLILELRRARRPPGVRARRTTGSFDANNTAHQP